MINNNFGQMPPLGPDFRMNNYKGFQPAQRPVYGERITGEGQRDSFQFSFLARLFEMMKKFFRPRPLPNPWPKPYEPPMMKYGGFNPKPDPGYVMMYGGFKPDPGLITIKYGGFNPPITDPGYTIMYGGFKPNPGGTDHISIKYGGFIMG